MTRMLVACVTMALGAPAALADDRTVRTAMEDEQARTLKELRVSGEVAPYHVIYTLVDTETASVSANFGALTSSNLGKQRWLRVDVRVGDRKQDNTGFNDGGFFSRSSFPFVVPSEDDYLALRRELWLRTDEAFKRALETLAKKKAAEQSQAKAADEPAFDLAEAKRTQVQDTPDEARKTPDKAPMEKIARGLSSVFRDFPEIQSSGVTAQHSVVRRRTLTSDGSWVDESRSLVRVQAEAEAQADDGLRLRRYTPFNTVALTALPPLAEMQKAVRETAQALTAARSAPMPESGNAVVLFEDRAAAQVVRRLLGDHLSGTPAPRSSAERRSSEQGSELSGKLNQKVAPAFLTVIDDPLAETGPGGTPLFGHYQADDEAVPAERVTVIERGVLKTLLTTRTPGKEIPRSNGHARGLPQFGAYQGQFSNLFVSAGKDGLDDRALRARALKTAREMGNDTPVYVVRLIDSGVSLGGDMDGGEGRGASVQPLAIYRLGKDGKEQPVRGLTLEGLRPKAFKDVVAAGRAPIVYNGRDTGRLAGPQGIGQSVITPALLFRDVEVQKNSKKNPRRPLYGHPVFAKE